VALSNVTILSGALASFLCNVWRSRAHSCQPLIDWDIIGIMEPTTVLGALLGSYLNKVGAVGARGWAFGAGGAGAQLQCGVLSCGARLLAA
jgi:uncharacterized membrane protein YfcA